MKLVDGKNRRVKTEQNKSLHDSVQKVFGLTENRKASMLAAELQQNKGKDRLYLQCLVLKEATVYSAGDKTGGQMSENILSLAVTVDSPPNFLFFGGP